VIGLALHNGAKKNNGIEHPYHSDEYIDRPLQFGVFLALGYTQGQGDCRRQDNQLPAPKGKSSQCVGNQSHLTGTLYDVIRRGEER
jgi:hypothetical protein